MSQYKGHLEKREDPEESMTRMEDKVVEVDKAEHNVRQEEAHTWGREMEEVRGGAMDPGLGEQEEIGAVGAKDENGIKGDIVLEAPSGEG